MRATAILVTILVVLFVGMGSAMGNDADTGNDLYDLMNSNMSYERGLAIGFIQRVMDTTDFIQMMAHKPYLWKFPSGVTVGQAIAVIKLYLEKHPEERHSPSPYLIHKALSEAFPP